MKGRITPIRNARYVAMFNRIEMQVIHVPFVISLITDSVFPKSPSPDTTLALGRAHGRALLGWRYLFTETNLQRLDAIGEIVIARWKRGNKVHVLGQHHPTVDMEWPLRANLPHRRAQCVNPLYQSEFPCRRSKLMVKK